MTQWIPLYETDMRSVKSELGTFAKVFPEDFRARLWPERLENDPRFADLDIEQVDLRDGWLGVAVGPKRQDADTAYAPQSTRQ